LGSSLNGFFSFKLLSHCSFKNIEYQRRCSHY
jgi:hypothetical protein